MLNLFRKHPSISGMIIAILGAVLGFFLHNPEMVASLLTIAGVFLGVRQVVVPVTDATVKITEAATTTATKVVESLNKTVVGTVGTVTPAAETIIKDTVHEVVGGVFGGDGVVRGVLNEVLNKK